MVHCESINSFPGTGRAERRQLTQNRPRKCDGASRLMLLLDPDLSTIELDDLPHDRQADPASLPGFRIQPDKRLEDPLAVLWRNAAPIIDDGKMNAIAVSLGRDSDFRAGSVLREFDGVSN